MLAQEVGSWPPIKATQPDPAALAVVRGAVGHLGDWGSRDHSQGRGFSLKLCPKGLQRDKRTPRPPWPLGSKPRRAAVCRPVDGHRGSSFLTSRSGQP